MPLTPHLVIFAKQPRLGCVKTRLARDIGPVAALAFYRRTLARIARSLARDPRWRTWLAVTPDNSIQEDRLWPVHTHRMTQGSGDLGARMGRAFTVLPPGPVVIVGTDIPDIAPAHIAEAFRLLGRNDAVFGPATDGGYWLVGHRRRPRMPDLFKGVRWSTAEALADTRANLPPRSRVEMLDELADIDDAASLQAWRNSLL